MSVETQGLQLRTLIKRSGELELSLVDVPTPEPGPDEVVVRIEAAPINPSDLGLLVGAADLSTLQASGTKARPVITAKVPEAGMRAMAGRLDESLPIGNEGAGTVVKTGSSEAAKALMGRTVAAIGGAMYSQYRCLKISECLPLPTGTTAAEGASCFVNPLTSLGMTETMRREGHTALVHTAAASNLGQMLNKICLKDGIPLVNIVRSAAQAEILRGIGATYIVDSTSPTFMDELIAALVETGATIAFEQIDGPPPQIFDRMVNVLDSESKLRSLAIVSREAPAAYRVRTYLSAQVVSGKSVIAWVFDVYDRNQQRALRLSGEEPVGRGGRD
ncbi:MAG: hypothetical protein E6447_08170, partial [Bradyrhizobium sp.]|nr:hypothetical protein [Bradyrhizobium sp.]